MVVDFALVTLLALVQGPLALQFVLAYPSISLYPLVAFTFPAILALGAIGMYGYIRMRRIGPRWLWIGHLLVSWPMLLIGVGTQLALLLSQLRMDTGIGLWSVLPPLTRLVVTLGVGLPLLFALGRYVSHFSHLWARPPIN